MGQYYVKKGMLCHIIDDHRVNCHLAYHLLQ